MCYGVLWCSFKSILKKVSNFAGIKFCDFEISEENYKNPNKYITKNKVSCQPPQNQLMTGS